MPRKWPAARPFLISAVLCPVGVHLFGLWKQAESRSHSSRSFGLALARGGAELEITVGGCPGDSLWVNSESQRLVKQEMGEGAAFSPPPPQTYCSWLSRLQS